MPSKNLHILLADDETEISSLIASVLQSAGHFIDLAEDGRSALDLLNANPGRYDLVITDSNMPFISGVELIQHLRKTGFPGKIILLTGYVADKSDAIYRELNIDWILQKPFPLSDLTKAVKETSAD